MRGRTRGVAGSTPRAWRWPRVISAALRVVGIAAAPAPRAAGQRLGHVDHAPAAERDEQVALDASSRSPATSSTRPAGTWCTAAAPATTAGAERRGARRREQHVAVAEQVRRLGQGAAPEAHDPLAVAPGEVAGHGRQHGKRQPPSTGDLDLAQRVGWQLCGVGVTLSAPTAAPRDALSGAPLGDLHARTALVALALVREAPGTGGGAALLRALRERPGADAAALLADGDADARALAHGAIALCAQQPDRASWVVPTIAEQFPGALSLQEDGVAWALLPARAADDAARATTAAAQRVAARLGARTAVGLSPFVTGPERLHDALRQARIVLELTRSGEVDVEEATTGTWRLLLAMALPTRPSSRPAWPPASARPSTTTRACGPRSSPPSGPISHHGANMNATAAAIYAHRHTVAARLERLAALTRLDPMRHEDRERLGVGMKARAVLERRPPISH